MFEDDEGEEGIQGDNSRYLLKCPFNFTFFIESPMIQAALFLYIYGRNYGAKTAMMRRLLSNLSDFLRLFGVILA